MNTAFSLAASLGGVVAASDFGTQMRRFWSLEDPSVRTAILGTLLLGMTCGLLGSFVVLRRLSLLGDSLGHAVLPGICAGFLVTMTKDIRWIFTGAALSAMLAAGVIALIQRRTRLKQDAVMGLVLSGFYGLGVVMLTRLQNSSSGNQSGLNRFLFGQASAISTEELKIMAVLAGIVLVVVLLAYKELAATSFDEEFAAACGIPARAIHYLLMMLVAIAIVISIQAVGIVLLSAMLITPAATAYLLTDRLKVMILLSVMFGAVAGVAGANISFLESHLPTGPFIVAVLTLFFVAAFFFSPQQGLLTRLHRRHRRQRQTLADQLVRLLHVGTSSQAQSIEKLAQEMHTSDSQVRKAVNLLRGDGLVKTDAGGLQLTTIGREYAEMLDRNAKLWELFLAQEGTIADVPFDPDTDDIEQVLGVDLKRQLEGQLNGVH
ncbi:Manganese transport system membrane protein MntB [Symmachiella macrocystis]|uniref:Manganese transport system membrane protein MntB n=1 Tax=Symmachiella macrocystis TaxID=2527985 RepID=A0A5C6BJW8_9PLAN|nr:iron chelate uptake ABC transporter family permease subunit [Symmachiella macrocystis]TWU12368.1 Manganese transport system membrane protein MntB [Symmachiella macrocystis]